MTDQQALDGLAPVVPETRPAARGQRVEFDVYGVPYPQGSLSPFIDRATGQARNKPSGGSKFGAWRNAIAERAERERDLLGAPLDGPLRLTVTFRHIMPSSTIRKGHRLAGWRWKTTTPDLDKLVRSVGDAITFGGLIVDDRLIVEIVARKVEVVSDWTGARVIVEALT